MTLLFRIVGLLVVFLASSGQALRRAAEPGTPQFGTLSTRCEAEIMRAEDSSWKFEQAVFQRATLSLILTSKAQAERRVRWRNLELRWQAICQKGDLQEVEVEQLAFVIDRWVDAVKHFAQQQERVVDAVWQSCMDHSQHLIEVGKEREDEYLRQVVTDFISAYSLKLSYDDRLAVEKELYFLGWVEEPKEEAKVGFFARVIRRMCGATHQSIPEAEDTLDTSGADTQTRKLETDIAGNPSSEKWIIKSGKVSEAVLQGVFNSNAIAAKLSSNDLAENKFVSDSFTALQVKASTMALDFQMGFQVESLRPQAKLQLIGLSPKHLDRLFKLGGAGRPRILPGRAGVR